MYKSYHNILLEMKQTTISPTNLFKCIDLSDAGILEIEQHKQNLIFYMPFHLDYLNNKYHNRLDTEEHKEVKTINIKHISHPVLL